MSKAPKNKNAKAKKAEAPKGAASKTKAEETIDAVAEIERLAKLDDLAYIRARKEAAEKLDIPVGDLNKLVAARRKALGPRGNEEEPPQKTDAELAASARDIIDCEAVLALFAKEVGKVISGEDRNAKIVYLNATTRIFDRCNHTAIKGPSACGKSELRTRVLDFMPHESVISFTALSEKALLFEKRSFEHKILSMGEAAATEDAEFQDYLLREFMSEGRLRYLMVQKVDGELITIPIEKEGPVSFVVTTTRNILHPENETRLLSIEVNDSADQTKKVLAKVAEVHGLNSGRSAINLEPWQDFQRWVERGNCKVTIPYAVPLAELIPPSAVRLRRDFAQLLLAIKAHALIHRTHRQLSERGEIIADIERDYAAVRDIMKDVMAESSGKAAKASVIETVEAVEQAMKEANLLGDDGVTSQQVARVLKLDNSAAYRRLKGAVSDGYVTNLETRPRQPGKYVCSGQQIESSEALPTVERLLSAAIPSETAAIVQSPPLSHCFSRDDPIAHGTAIGGAIDVQSAPIASAIADCVAIDKGLEINDLTPPIARLQANRRGETDMGRDAGTGQRADVTADTGRSGAGHAGNRAPALPPFVRAGGVRLGTRCHVCGAPGIDADPVASIRCTNRPGHGSWPLHMRCAPAFFDMGGQGGFEPGTAHVFEPGGNVTRLR